MLRPFFLCLLLAHSFIAPCADGCLKCSPTNDCLYCDFTNGYVLKDNLCIRQPITNCLMMNEKGVCVLCDTNYYVDFYYGYCLEVPQANRLDNCVTYQSLAACSICASGYYVKDGKCVAATQPVPQCKILVSEGRCSQCIAGHSLSLDGKTCTKSSGLNNCSAYSPVSCTTCKDGFYRNQNFYINYIFQESSSMSFRRVTSRITNQSLNIVDEGQRVCQRISIQNCVAYESSSKCARCEEGFYLTDAGLCTQNAIQGVPNCVIYTSQNACIKCAPNFYIGFDGVCYPNINIDFCQIYDSSANSPSCLLCQEGYYLFGDNNCIKRSIVSEINFCTKLSPYLERCDVCATGYGVSDDGLLCLELIPNCLVYEPSSKGTIANRCKVCNEGYFYSPVENFCKLGTVDNCRVYSHQANVCSICNNGFYLVNGLCLSQKPLKNCKDYSGIVRDSCNNCENQSMHYWVANGCVEMKGVPNCFQYNLKGECTQCEDGYYIENGNASRCVQIPPDKNCLQLVGLTCTKCISGFALNNGVCDLPIIYKYKNCAIHNLNGTTSQDQFVCQSCKEFSIPLNYKNHLQCVENNIFVEKMAKNLVPDPGCRGYDFNPVTQTATCIFCVPGRVLDENNRCVETCLKTGFSTLYREVFQYYNLNMEEINDSVSINTTNICGPSIPNCEVAVPSLHQNFIESRYSCARCDPLKIKVLPPPEYLERIPSLSSETVAVPATRNVVTGFNCENPSPNLILGMFDRNSTIQGCDLYSNVLQNILGCQKCVTGQHAVVYEIVKNCEIYTENTFNCTRCQRGYYLTQIGVTFECKEIVDVPFCVKYDPSANRTLCTGCDDDHFLSNETCLIRQNSFRIANCIVNATSDNCTCSRGLVMNTNTSACVPIPRYCVNATFDAVNGVRCILCQDTRSYLNSNVCELGSIANCKTYDATSNTCRVCNDTFYLASPTSCLPHNTTRNPNCVGWDPLNLNKCLTCSNTSLLATVTQVCNTTIGIPNCLVHYSPFECETCADGFYSVNYRRRCVPIPDSFNCTRMTPIKKTGGSGRVDGTDILIATDEWSYTCNMCKPMFPAFSKLVQSGGDSYIGDVCSAGFPWLRNNCEDKEPLVGGVHVNLQTSDYVCKGCAQGTYPRDFSGNLVCMPFSTMMDLATVPNGVSTISQSLNRCRVFGDDLKCKDCLFPQGQTIVAGDIQCVDCPNALLINSITNVNTTDFTFVRQNVCGTPTVTNCVRETQDALAPAAPGAHPFKCIKCQDGYLPVINTNTSSYTLIKYGAESDSISNPRRAFSIVETCQQTWNKVRGVKDRSGIVYNCEYYYQTDNGYIGCIRCKHGYTGTIQGSAGARGFINYCEPMTDCDASVVYDGFHNPGDNKMKIDDYFSCHKCLASDKIPVAFVRANNDTNSTFYRLDGVGVYHASLKPFYNVTLDNAPIGRSVECLSYTQLNNNYSQVPSGYGINGTLVPNCAMYFVNILSSGNASDARSLNPNRTSMAAWCAACKPGFYPTYANYTVATADEVPVSANEVVISCNVFDPPCDPSNSGSLINTCGSGIFSYNHTTDKVNFTKVVSTTAISDRNRKNCFAMDNFGNCRICKKGSSMNRVGECVIEVVPNCDSNMMSTLFNNMRFTKYDWTDVFYSLYQQEEVGCTSCSGDNVLFKIPAAFVPDSSICMALSDAPTNSTYVKTGVADLNPQTYHFNTSSLIPPDFCLKYYINKADSAKYCKKCVDGYALTHQYTCVPNSLVVDLQNCLLIENLINRFGQYTKCKTCKTGFLNIAGLCYDQSVSSPRITPNCSRFDNTTSATSTNSICFTCNSQFYLKSNACLAISVANCDTANPVTPQLCTKCLPFFSLITLSNGKTACYPLGAAGIMDFDPNCLEVDATEFGTNTNLKCTKCRSNFFLQSLDVSTNYQFCQNFSGSLLVPGCMNYDKTSPFSATNLGCLTCNTTAFYKPPGLSTCMPRRLIEPNCLATNSSFDTCTTCRNDTYLSLDKLRCLRQSGPRIGYLGLCRDMGECKLTEYDNLPVAISTLLSCHECKDADRIPFLFASAGNFTRTLSLRRFSMNSTAPRSFLDGDGDRNVRCLPPSASTFNIQSNFNFPANCAIGVVNLDFLPSAADSSKQTGFSPSQASVFCAACKPKFAPVYANVNGTQIGYFATACNQIANCDYSNSFSTCTLCAKGFSFMYNRTRGIIYDTCVDNGGNINCLAMGTVGTKKVCHLCRKGFYKNIDGICELIDPPKCMSGSFSFKTQLEGLNIATAIRLDHSGPGCSQCQPGFIGVRTPISEYTCTESSQHSGNLLLDNTRFVKNCKNYEVDLNGNFNCAVCNEGFTLTVTKKCIASSTMAPCRLFNGVKCHNCDNTTALSDRICGPQSIANCAQYANTTTIYEPVCVQCAPGYYIDANACLPSAVQNCRVHANERLCNECQPGYALVLARNITSYCIPIDTSLNCNTFEPFDFQSRLIRCQTCIRPNFILSLSQSDFNKTHCMPFTEIPNCKAYETTISIASTTFNCLSCNDNYFLANNTCVSRSLQFMNCLNYSAINDTCVQCTNGFYLSGDGKTCVPFPSGIVGCLRYISKTQCATCDKKYFLASGNCVPLDDNNIVPNCVVHLQPSYCKKCDKNFLAVAGECRPTFAENCLTFHSPFICETCNPGFGLVAKGDLVNCVQKPDSNCLTSVNTSPFNCTRCIKGFYNSNNVCTQVPTPIANCDFYDDAATCSQCAPGFALSVNRTSCDSGTSLSTYIDLNCASSTLGSDPTCTTCTPGYYFVDDKCVICPQNNINIGCFSCNPENPMQCLMCAPGYFMDTNSQCNISLMK